MVWSDLAMVGSSYKFFYGVSWRMAWSAMPWYGLILRWSGDGLVQDIT